MNEVTEVKENANALINAEDVKATAIQWLTSTGNLQKFTEQEKSQFIDICVAYGLNPIKREVYGIKYKDNFNIIVGYEVYLKRAQRSGLLDGFETTVRDEGNDTIATCTIYRKDWSKPFVHEVYLSEYKQSTPIWQQKPKTMIKKVAEAQAFRKCFTDELGGMPYTADELPEQMEKADTSSLAKEASEPVIAPKAKFTKAQAEEIGALLHGATEDKKAYYRDMLKTEGYLKTKAKIEQEIAINSEGGIY